MGKQQVIALCGCNAALYAGLAGVVGLMPVYLARLGAGPGLSGIFLAVAYLALAGGNLVGGRLADRLRRRKPLLILDGSLAAPTAWLLGTATAVAPLLLLIACRWFAMGTAMAMVTILAGLGTPEGKRGATFGLLSLGAGLGLLIGALCSGPIADRWGYPALFAALAMLYALVPLAGLVVRERESARTPCGAAPGAGRRALGDQAFLFLFAGSILAQAANSVGFLGRTLIMHDLRFNATAITTAVAIGQLATLPLPLLIGRLSDRLGRGPAILLCFLAPAPGLIVLALAVDAWQFWLESALQAVLGVSMAAASALMADVFPKEVLGTALALLNATPWVGIVLGLSGGGLAFGAFGMAPTLLLCALLSLCAAALLLPISAYEHRGAGSARRRASLV